MGENKIVYIKNTLNNLRVLLDEFQNSHFYSESKDSYDTLIGQINKAILLTERGISENHPIDESDTRVFQGDRFVEEAFNLREDKGGKYYEIYKLYTEMSSYVYSVNYFR